MSSYQSVELLRKSCGQASSKKTVRILRENDLLHPGQMGGREKRCAIDAVAILIQEVQTSWNEGKIAGALFMM